MIYLDILIISIMAILWFVIKDIIRYIKLLCILYLVSGYLMIIMGFLIKTIIKSKVVFINIDKIGDSILKMFINKGLWLILWGGLLLIIYVIVITYRHYKDAILISCS